MKILYVHERLGSLAGAEANALITGQELTNKGHQLGLLHGPSTGKNLDAWNNAVKGGRKVQRGAVEKCGT